MTTEKDTETAETLVLEYTLDASREKVWRAISIPAFREQWLPQHTLVHTTPVSSTPGESVCYALRDDEPPFLESLVTFQIRPDTTGGSILTIIHTLTDARLNTPLPRAANDDTTPLMLAA